MRSNTKLPGAFEGASARSNTYNLIARHWLLEVDQDLLQRLLAPPLHGPFVQAGGILPSDACEQTVEQLAMEFCRLFIGPAGHLPPYQSVWETGQLQGTTIASMQRFINIAGYDCESMPGRAMLDHFGVQLAVMGHILEQVAHGQFDSAAIEAIQEFANSYLARHLRWPVELLIAASNQAKTDFYRSMIVITSEFLECEWDIFQ